MNNTAPLAGRFRRLCATLIDALLVPSLTILLVMITGVVEDAEDYANSWWILWVFLLAVLSYLLLNGYGLWRNGQTLGKRMLGIRIVRARHSAESSASENGAAEDSVADVLAPLWKLICIRALFFPLLFCVIVPWLGLLPLLDQLAIFGKQRRCLHDWAAGTRVVLAR